MKNTLLIITGVIFLALSSCRKDVTPSCEDGILNQDEIAIDCGGVCDSCPNAIYPFVYYPLYGKNGALNVLHSSFLDGSNISSPPALGFKAVFYNDASLSVHWITNNSNGGTAMAFKYGWTEADPDYQSDRWFHASGDSSDAEFWLPPPGSSIIEFYENGADTTGPPTFSKSIIH